MKKVVQSLYNPFGTIICLSNNKDIETLAEIIPGVEGKIMVDGLATAYVCENFACNAPVTNISQLIEQLGQN